MTARIPLVDYLALEPAPHLLATECTHCQARFFGLRYACASCSGTDFRQTELEPEGEVVSFSIVAFAAPGVPTPFVPAVVDCSGTWVKANLINVDPDPAKVWLGQKVRLATYSLGMDEAGAEGVGFGFEPVE